MSQQIKVERKIQFVGDANQEANVEGNFLTKRACRVDWFDQKALDETNGYTITVDGTGDTVAVSGGGVIGVTMTTGSGDNEVEYFAPTPLVFDISQNPAIEAKIQITDVSGTVVFFGFSDAITETSPNSTIDYADGTLAAAATDAVGFVIDGDKSSSAVYCASIATGGSVAATAAAPSTVWTDAQAKVLRVELDSSGNARFYIDGVQVGYKATAVTDVPLCAIINAGNREAAANTVYVRYLAKFQDIP
jgi:hypothetical protein